MADELPDHRPPASRATERLFTFDYGTDRYHCELVDHEPHGLEVRFVKNSTFMLSRRFDTREEAIRWAHIERDAIVKSWGIW